MDPSTTNDDTWLDNAENAGSYVVNFLTGGLYGKYPISGQPGDLVAADEALQSVPTMASVTTAVNSAVDNAGQQVSSLLPSGAEVAGGAIFIVVVLVLILFILGKVDSL